MLRGSFIALSLMALAGAAAAQEATPASPEPKDQSTANAVQGLQEIVVTAQRREQSSQRAALPIQALTTADLARAQITQPESLNAVATGVSVATGGEVPQVYIRGVGNYATNIYSESAVAWNDDGVYISRAWELRGAFFDLDRIEVLKGPQGTLYGRNASGGAINLISARPRLDKAGGYLEGEIGNYNLFSGNGAVNIPLNKDLAVRVSGEALSHSGYLDDGYDDEKDQAGRVQLLYQPSDALSMILRGQYQHAGGRGAGVTITTGYGNQPFMGAGNPLVARIIRAEPFIGPLLVVQQPNGFLDSDVYALSGELDWNFGPATLTLIPAWRYGKNSDRFYVSSYDITQHEFDRQTSFEARLSNETDQFKWVAGLFYFDEKQGSPAGEFQELDNALINGEQRYFPDIATRSYAAFGQATYSITHAFRLTGGLRYTYERKTQNGVDNGYNGFLQPPAPPSTCLPGYTIQPNPAIPYAPCHLLLPIEGRLTYNSVTYKAGIEYDLAPESMLYANVSTGFKSGGFFPAPAPDNSFSPEKLTAYELGVKNRFLDNRLQLNVEGFYWLYKNHQESHLGPTSIGDFFTFITQNAGQAKSYGLEVDTDYLVTPSDELRVSVQNNETKYDSFVYTYPSGVVGPPTVGCQVTGQITSPLSLQTVNCSGFQLVRAPKWTGNARYDHTFGFSNGGTLDAGVGTEFSSGYWLSVDFLPNGRQGSYAVLNSDLTYTSASRKWSVSAWGRNLTNSVIFTEVFRSPYISAANPLADPNGLVEGSVAPPRTFGIRARVSF